MRVAVVTGASSGIGAATARLLAARGWRCVLLSRRPEPLARLAAELGAEAEPCDVGDRSAVDAAAARVAGRHEAVHLLVSNAGIPGGGGFLDVTAERIEEVTRTNYLGGVWTLRAFLALLEAGAPSDVVNVSSVAGVWATGGSSGPYTASKHAQLAFSRAVSVELAPRGIRVHAVNPGPVRTEGFPQARLRGTKLDRFVLEPERVAEAILRAVERDRAETYVFGGYRVAGILQAAFPGTIARVAAARRRRRRG
ncbi:MAG TPA: SDR family oxidoreductase [Gaiellaceae bacterium]|nr:SDR family oxidoreductase [Gaiellaceae bacterium]